VLILNAVKVFCFDTLLQVLILKVVSRETYGTLFGLKKTREPAPRQSDKITRVKVRGGFRDSGVLPYRANYTRAVTVLSTEIRGGNSSAIVTLDDASLTEHSD